MVQLPEIWKRNVTWRRGPHLCHPMAHWGGGSKLSQKKCHVLFEWPLRVCLIVWQSKCLELSIFFFQNKICFDFVEYFTCTDFLLNFFIERCWIIRVRIKIYFQRNWSEHYDRNGLNSKTPKPDDTTFIFIYVFY